MIGAVGDAGLLSRLADGTASVRKQLDTVLEQQSSGKVSSTYAGLGSAARTSLDLRPAVQHLQTWQSNIDAVSGRLDVTQSALKQVAAIAQDFYARTNSITDTGASQASTIGAAAKQALEQVAQLLNTKAGDVYVFAGQDSATPPIPNTDPTVVGAALLASDTSTEPFSATVGPVTTVEIGEGQRVATGVLANQNTLATSTAPTTGSYMCDVMRALATLANVTDSPGAVATAADTRTRLSSAIDAMADESGVLGNIQSSLSTRQTALASMQTSLTKQVSGAEDVDLASVLTKISAIQQQLQSSYQVIAQVKDLSLTKYL